MARINIYKYILKDNKNNTINSYDNLNDICELLYVNYATISMWLRNKEVNERLKNYFGNRYELTRVLK